jgi:hypothetical protein
MKTHTSRWQQAGPGVWLLKERAQDGGAVLAGIQDRGEMGYSWGLTGHYLRLAPSRYAAQRAVRAALTAAERGGGG